MAYPPKFPFADVLLAEGTTSIATTPIAAVFVAPCAGILRKIYAAAGGTTSGTITVAAVVNNGSDVTAGALTIAAGSNARNGSNIDLPKVGTSAVIVAENDIITLTPSGGTGANIPGAFSIVIRKF